MKNWNYYMESDYFQNNYSDISMFMQVFFVGEINRIYIFFVLCGMLSSQLKMHPSRIETVPQSDGKHKSLEPIPQPSAAFCTLHTHVNTHTPGRADGTVTPLHQYLTGKRFPSNFGPLHLSLSLSLAL